MIRRLPRERLTASPESSQEVLVGSLRPPRDFVERSHLQNELRIPKLRLLVFLVSLGARAIRAMCRRRADLVLANLALRQQVAVLKKHRPRPTLGDTDRGVPIALLRCPTTAPRDRPVRIDSVLIMMSHRSISLY